MKKITPVFNRFEVLSSDADFLQTTKEQEIADRLKDSTAVPGIVLPSTGTALDIQNFVPLIFPIADAGAGKINVGPTVISTSVPQVAYDAAGERIELPFGDAVGFNENSPIFNDPAVTGTPIIPFSTGRKNILTPNIPGTAHNAGTATETRYVFIAYLQIAETESLPPDHLTPNPTLNPVLNSLTPSSPPNSPNTTIDELTGQAFNHRKINGYRIYVALGPDTAVTGGSEVDLTGAIPKLISLNPNNEHNPEFPGANTSFPNFANALYIGQYQITSTPTIPAASIQPSGKNTDTPRPILTFRGVGSAIVPTQAQAFDLTDPNNPVPLLTYQDGQRVTFSEHASARGTGTVTSENPHGNKVSDFTAGQLTPDLAALQSIGLDDGILDNGIRSNFHPANAPLTSTALRATVSNSSINSPNSLKFASATGPDFSLSGTFDASVTLKQLNQSGAIQVVYVQGSRLEQAFPRLEDSGNLSFVGVVDAFVPFSAASDTIEGIYTIFIKQSDDPSQPNIGVLGKALKQTSSGGPGVTLSPNRLPLMDVYWRPAPLSPYTHLQKDQFDLTLDVVDRRSIGLVSTQEISTLTLANPNRGSLSQQRTDNLLVNPDFRDPSGSPTTPDNWVVNSSPTGTVALTQTNDTLDSTLFSQDPGPKNTSAGILAFGLSGGSLDVNIRGLLPSIKPNTVYTFSTWARFSSTGNPIVVTASILNATLTNTTGEQTLVLNRQVPTTTWQRVAVQFKTNTTVTKSASILYLHFTNPTGATAGDNSITLANLMVTEGEWAIQFSTGVQDTISRSRTVLRSTNSLPNGGSVAAVLSSGNLTVPGVLVSIVSDGTQISEIFARCYLNITFPNPGAQQEFMQATLRISDSISGTLDTIHVGLGGYTNDVDFPTFQTSVVGSWKGVLSAGTHNITIVFSAFTTGPKQINVQIGDVVLEAVSL